MSVLLINNKPNKNLTPWSRFLLENLIAFQLVKKHLSFIDPKFHYRIHKSPLLDSILRNIPNPLILFL